MMDDFDIYSDLPDFAWLKGVYEEDVEIKKEELPISENEIKELKEKLLKLEKVHKLVLSHYSSLWKTSKQERKRMDRQIADLRSQLDNFAFKRNHHRSAVLPPVPVQSLIAYPTKLQASNNYPPLLMSATPFSKQQIVSQQHHGNSYCHQPTSINPALESNQEWNQLEEQVDKHFVENHAVPSNVITPENSHGSDESEDDVIKKSEYRSTVYGERLRKKLLEEKRNAMRQKKESVLDEKKVNQKPLNDQKQNALENANEVNKVHDLKEKEVTSMKKETDVRTVKEENNNRRQSEIEKQNVKEFSNKEGKLKNENEFEQVEHQKRNELETANKVNELHVLKEKGVMSEKKEIDMRTVKEENTNKRQNKIETCNVKESDKQEQNLRNEKEFEAKENKKEYEPRIKSDIDKKRREEDLRIRKRDDIDKKRRDDDFKFRRARDYNKKMEDRESKMQRERDLERRKREDESSIRRERDLERKRKEEEIERTKQEEQFEKKRREEESEKKRKDQDTERRKKEDIDKRRRVEVDRRRKDEEIERRKRDEFDRRRKEEDKKRKERELEILKEKENEQRRNEEEQHVKKLKEIEKKRNEKQLEDLIKERQRIENEMNSLKDDVSEEEEKPKSVKDTLCKEQSAVEKSQIGREISRGNFKDTSKQPHEKQSDNRTNDEGNAVQHSLENKNSSSVNSNAQTTNENRRNNVREHASSKSDRHNDKNTSYDKHKYNDRRSRRDPLNRERERRKSLHRNKTRHRNSKSNSGHRSDEDKSNYSPKRIKLQERDRDSDNRLKNHEANKTYKMKVKSPKRRRQTKSDERSPQKSKKRKISQDRDVDCNIKSNENTIQNTNVETSKKLDEGNIINSKQMFKNCTKNIIHSVISNKNISIHTVGTRINLVENRANIKENLKEEKNKLTAPFAKDQDKVSTKLTDPREALQVVDGKEDQLKDSNKDQSKLVNTVTVKKSIDHANKMKTLINELFEDEERPIGGSDNVKNLKQLHKTLDETVLSEMEDGEVTDSDESMDSVNLPKSALHCQFTDRPIETITFVERNKFGNDNNKNEFTSLQKSDVEAASKCTIDIKDSILYNVLTQSKHDSSKKNDTIEAHEEISTKKEPATLINCKIPVTCNNIANKAADKSSQIISHIERKINKNSETIGTRNANKNKSAELEETKTIVEPSDKIKAIIEKEKQTNGNKTDDCVTVGKTDLEKSAKCILNPTVPNILLQRPNPNRFKNNNSENKIDNNERFLNSKGSEIHSESNSMKDMCLKENVDVGNDLKKNIGQSLIKTLNKESSKPVAKIETPSKENAANNSVNASPNIVPLRNVIVIKRRRRPVQLSDSPPVVVINNPNLKT